MLKQEAFAEKATGGLEAYAQMGLEEAWPKQHAVETTSA